jgi:osmotically-inducible protein OsmY
MDSRRVLAVKQTLTSALLILLVSGCTSVAGPSDAGVRTSLEMRTDERIASDVQERIRGADWRFDKSHIVVASHRAVVLLAGQVPSEELRQLAQQVAQAAAEVRRVHNELIVGPAMPVANRAGDAWLATKVNSALASDATIDERLVDVTVVDGAVYLLGRLAPAQADAAVTAIQAVPGVKKIVRVFEYVE